MRHRDPTTMAPSLGIYMDASRVLNPCDISASSNVAGAAAALNPPGVFVAATAAINSSFTNLSPILSSIRSPTTTTIRSPAPPIFSFPVEPSGHSGGPATPQRHPLAVCQSNELRAQQSQSEVDSKRRKRPKTRRRTLRPTSGDGSRNWHSLKVTIRRTSQTHKVHPLICLTRSESSSNRHSDVIPMNGTHSRSDLSAPSDYSSGDMSSGRTVPAVGLVDASTSTDGCGIATDPNPQSPCQPGTKVVIEGVVWLEASGMLVLNAQWRGRSYMGTLLDASSSNFGPSCMDKGMKCALNLLEERYKSKSNSPSKRLQTRGLRRYSRHHHNLHPRCRVDGAVRTTRSAAAAAAAAAVGSAPSDATTMSSEQPSDSSGTFLSGVHEDAQLRLAVYDLDFTGSSGVSHQSSPPTRGGRRRRRRGGGASGRPYRRVGPKIITHQNSTSITEPSPLGERENVSTPSPNVLFDCLFGNCGQRFHDFLSLRHHMVTDHSDRTPSDSVSLPKLTSAVNPTNPVNLPQESHSCRSSSATTQSGTLTSPPKLSRAPSAPDVDSDENSFVNVSADDRFDDNRAPPRLHRISSVGEGFSSQPSRPPSPPTDQQQSCSPNDEPPAPSPAYSDISDEGIAPIEQNKLPVAPLFSDASCGQLFTVQPSSVSPMAVLLPRQSGLDFLGSALMTSANNPFSPTIRSETKSNFYLTSLSPAQSVAATPQSTLTGIPLALKTLRTPPREKLPTNSLNSLKYPSGTPSPYTVQNSATMTTVIPNSYFQPPPPVCIPGVNSFAVPPIGSPVPRPNGHSLASYASFGHIPRSNHCGGGGHASDNRASPVTLPRAASALQTVSHLNRPSATRRPESLGSYSDARMAKRPREPTM